MRPSSWIPPVAWMAVIAMLSSASFSSDRTGGVVLGLLAWAPAWLVPVDVATLHGTLRKAAHLIAYAILALLWFRALIRDTARPTWVAAAGAFTLCVLWAALDETHQSLVPSRTGTARDVAVDSAGSLIALAVARRTWIETARALTEVLLWAVAVGGAAALVITLMMGGAPGPWWVTVPAATAVLAGRRWWRPTP